MAQGPWLARVEDDWPREGVRLLFARYTLVRGRPVLRRRFRHHEGRA